MPIEGTLGGLRSARSRLVIDYGTLTNRITAVMVFCGSIAIVEPSPYDFASVAAVPAWLLGGCAIHPLALLFAGLVFVYNLGGFISLVPHLDEPLPTMFMVQSLYLAVTAVFFALFFAEDTQRRASICLKAFAASTVLAAICGILGYFDVLGLGSFLSMYGRASGTFKDPNVLGSYLVMGALFFIQRLIAPGTRHPFRDSGALLILVLGVFLSFSRGSWLAFTIATSLMLILTFVTSPSTAARRKIVTITAVGAAAAILALGVLLSFAATRDFFLQRASVAQDYDVGETGRFGNQARSLGMLLDRLNGFGPLRFRLTFGLDPHNSYINAFASYGWLGASAFFLLVGLTMFIGFRLTLKASPFRTIAQVYWPALFVFLLQGLQIDIDHWRHVYLMLGAVWGLETARLRWQARGRTEDVREGGRAP